MDKKNYTCIVCPLGCNITLTIENEEIIEITGFTCKRGENFAKNEYKNPQRTLTTVVKLENSKYPCLPVISDVSIPKNKIKQCLEVLKNTKIKPPIKNGDLIIQNILSTGVNIIAAKTVKERG